MMLQKRLLLFMLLQMGLLSTLMAQQMEVKTYFDEHKKLIKEVYQVNKQKPNQINGVYKAYYPNGILKVQGTYREGVPTGNWQYYYQNGSIKMKGGMQGQVPTGHWEYYYENGNKSMEGPIAEGYRDGFWVFYYENGHKKNEGEFVKDEKIGLWQYYYEDGTLKAKALYEGGTGKYKEYYPSGKLKAVGFKSAGKSDSLWTFYYENAVKKAEGYYKEGLRTGEWAFYYPNGNVSSKGNYHQGKRNGHWEYYHKNEVVSSEGLEKDGKKEGFWKLYYEDGGLKGEGFFENGGGVYKEYYASGKLKIQGFLENGIKNGEWLYYFENGKLEGEVDFVNNTGDFTGYYKTGEIKMKGRIQDDQRVGTWTLFNKDGSVAGYYKTIYQQKDFDFKEGLATNALPFADTLNYEKPAYKFKANESKYFKRRLNEFQGIIITTNPIAVALGSIPFSVEYYMQERLGHEVQLTLIRDPFFTSDASIPVYSVFERGFSAALRQKFYQDDQQFGMFYFAHEVRFTKVDYMLNVSVNNKSNVHSTAVLEENCHKYEYSIIIGDRIMKDAGEQGITLDVFVGVGIGYRKYDGLDYSSSAVKNSYDEVPKSTLSIPVRLGLSIGYIF